MKSKMKKPKLRFWAYETTDQRYHQVSFRIYGEAAQFCYDANGGINAANEEEHWEVREHRGNPVEENNTQRRQELQEQKAAEKKFSKPLSPYAMFRFEDGDEEIDGWSCYYNAETDRTEIHHPNSALGAFCISGRLSPEQAHQIAEVWCRGHSEGQDAGKAEVKESIKKAFEFLIPPN